MSNTHDLPILRLSLADSAEIRSWSAGEVSKTSIFDDSNRPIEGGLHCPKLFGIEPGSSCACGRLFGFAHPSMRCLHCATRPSPNPITQLRYGHIELATPIVNPLALRNRPPLLAKLLGLAPKELRDIVYGHHEIYRGAKAIRVLLDQLDIAAEIAELRRNPRLRRSSPVRGRFHLLKRLQKADANFAGLVLDALPVIPSQFRQPNVRRRTGSVQISSLDQLYQRILMRNERIKMLAALAAPEVVLRNEARIMQRAVDELFFGRKLSHRGRIDKPILGLVQHLGWWPRGPFWPLQRGKRVDFSGRAIAVPDSQLAPNECVLPREQVALPLFEPELIGELVISGQAADRDEAEAMVVTRHPDIWESLAFVVEGRRVLIGRPGHHDVDRFLAFNPRLGNDKTIHLSPPVLANWGLTGQGEVVDIHLPLSEAAQHEAGRLNFGEVPTSHSIYDRKFAVLTEVALGCCLLTLPSPKNSRPTDRTMPFCFSNLNELHLALACGQVHLRQDIQLRLPLGKLVIQEDDNGFLGRGIDPPGHRIKTTVGRALLNALLPDELPYVNQVLHRPRLDLLIQEIRCRMDSLQAKAVVERLGNLACEALTTSGVSFGIADCPAIPKQHKQRLEEQVAKLEKAHDRYILTDQEVVSKLYDARIEFANKIERDLQATLRDAYDTNPSILSLAMHAQTGVSSLKMRNLFQTVRFVKPAGSGRDYARVDWPLSIQQRFEQLVPYGTCNAPFIRPSLRDGLSSIDYWSFAAHHRFLEIGNLWDDRAMTAYLMKMLNSTLGDVAISVADCGTSQGIMVRPNAREFHYEDPFRDTITGRVNVDLLCQPDSEEVLLHPGDVIGATMARRLLDMGFDKLRVRSPMTCEAEDGVCQHCYGIEPTTGTFPHVGTAVGRRAAIALGHALPRYTRMQHYLISSMQPYHDRAADWQQITYRLVPGYFEWNRPLVNVLDLLKLNVRRRCVLATCFGVVSAVQRGDEQVVTVVVRTAEDRRVEQRKIWPDQYPLVRVDDAVRAGDILSTGHPDIREVAQILGMQRAIEELHLALLALLDFGGGVAGLCQHVEVLVGQMANWVQVKNPSETGLMPGMVLSRSQWQRAVAGSDVAATAAPILVAVDSMVRLSDRSDLLKTLGYSSARSWLESALVNATGRLDRSAALHLFGGMPVFGRMPRT